MLELKTLHKLQKQIIFYNQKVKVLQKNVFIPHHLFFKNLLHQIFYVLYYQTH
jgi:hypothetical protein